MAAQASASKKKQKSKGKTLSLNDFLGDGPAPAAPVYKPSDSWADQIADDDVDAASDYGMAKMTRATLPTAPRAARGPAVDPSRIPSVPPYTAYIGNLPYDTDEEKVMDFFKGLKIMNVRIPNDGGRLRGFGYAEFEDKENLIEALIRNDECLQGRKIRVDLAEQNQKDGEMRQGDRQGRGGMDQNRGGDPDRTEDCDWRSNRVPVEQPTLSYDRGGRGEGGFDRDRRDGFGSDDRRGGYDDRRGGGFDDRRGGSDDRRGGGSDDRRGGGFDDRRGGGFDDRRGGGFDDRRGGGFDDRRGGGYDDRRRGYDDDRRDGGRFGGNRRGYGFSGDRSDDRYGDRDRGNRDDRGSSYRDERGPPRDRDEGGPPSHARDDYDRPARDGAAPAERPRLNLQKRTKPVEEVSKDAASKQSSIFGSAKPVDTAAKEREIEERLRRTQESQRERPDAEKDFRRIRRNSDRERRTSGSISDEPIGEPRRRERKTSSSSSGKGIRTVGPPPTTPTRTTARRDSELSNHSGDHVFDDDRSPPQAKPTTPRGEEPASKLVPAPPPAENIWDKRKKTVSPAAPAPAPSQPTPPKQPQTITSQNQQPSKPQSQTQQKSPSQPSTSPKENAWSKGKAASTPVLAAEPPKANVWAQRKQEQHIKVDTTPSATSESTKKETNSTNVKDDNENENKEIKDAHIENNAPAPKTTEVSANTTTIEEPKKKKVPTATLR